MKVSFKRRLIAYIIDLALLSILVTLTLVIFPNDKKEIKQINNNINIITEDLLNDKIDNSQYLNMYAKYNYKLEKKQIKTNVLNLIYIIFLYILVPFFAGGQTIGKIVTKIKIVNEDNTDIQFNKLIIRSLFVNFLIYPIVTIPLIYLFSAKIYFILSLFLILIEFLLVLFTIFMVLYRHDRKGIHDILTKTKVIKL
ncbi:MAG: RDD family protein [Bacilli bacterium]|nr:RDD family protein [Bacilli bacterium]